MMNFMKDFGEKLLSFLGENPNCGLKEEGTLQEDASRFFENHSIYSLLPYSTYDSDKGLFYNKDGVGFILETYPLVGSSEEMQREISGLFQTTLPEGSNIQFMLWADPRVGDILKDWRSIRDNQGDALNKIAKSRESYLRSLVFEEAKDSQVRNYRCIISYSQKNKPEGVMEMASLMSLKDQVVTAFKTLNMPLKLWDAGDLINTLEGILSITTDLDPTDLRWNPFDGLSEQMTKSTHGYEILRDGIEVSTGDNHTPFEIRSYSLRQEPEYWSLHAMGDLIGDFERDLLRIKVPFIKHYGIHICDQDKAKLKIQSKESWVEQQAHSKIGKRIPVIKKQARELNFVREQLGKGERFVQTSYSVSLLGPKEHINDAEQTLMSIYRGQRWQLRRDSFIQLQLFLSTLPMNWGEGIVDELKYHDRLKTTLSTEAANLLPIQGEWKGTLTPSMIFTGRRGQIFTWSPFDNDGGNYNVAVVGSSGSGKSVFMQELMTSTLGIGGQVFVLDVGRSFEKVAKLLGGQFIEFSTKSPVCINPFSLIPKNDEGEASDALAMLKPIISLMAAPNSGTTDLENALIEQALTEVWNTKCQMGSMTDVAAFLKNYGGDVAGDLSQKLYPYTKEGVYGRFFNGPSTVDLSSKLVVLELEELKERKDLQGVIVQIIILQITNQLYLGDRKTPTNLVLDEAWDMLRSKQSGGFIETAARRLRKYKGSLVVGTQSINDFYANPGAQAAFDNSDWICMLSQKAESIEMLKNSGRIKMDGAMESHLKSLKTKQGQYAEALIYGPHGFAVGRLLLDPFSLILYSTKAEEYAAVKSALDQGLTLESAVELISKRRAA
jgi:conjugal transfer ATP-binding protein TraC